MSNAKFDYQPGELNPGLVRHASTAVLASPPGALAQKVPYAAALSRIVSPNVLSKVHVFKAVVLDS